LFFAQSALQGL
jgi:hypothetical protein